MNKWVFTLAFVASPVVGWAACPEGTFPDPNDPNICYQANQEMNMDGDELNGEIMRPDGDHLTGHRGHTYSSLIHIRENFTPEMLKSAQDI